MTFLSLHPVVRDTAHQKLLGTIIGSALGDTIGLYTEFLSASVAEKLYPSRRFSLLPTPTPFHADGHRDRFATAAWTDDTDHALLLLLSYLHTCGDLDALPTDFASRLAIWSTQGLRCLDRLPVGMGKTISLAVYDPNFPSDPEAVALKLWFRTGRRAAANGSLMRTHPLGLMTVPLSCEAAFEYAARLSRTTHPDPRCVVACCAVVAIIRGILRGEVRGEADVDVLLEAAFKYVSERQDLCDPRLEESKKTELENDSHDDDAEDGGTNQPLDHATFLRHVQAREFTDLQLDDAMSMGFVYKCLGAGILALRRAMRLTRASIIFAESSSTTYKESQQAGDHVGAVAFEEIITEITMLGGDADTNCCVAGALVGAWVGFDGLPEHWLGGLQHREWLVSKSERLSRLIGIMEQSTEEEQPDSDTAPDGGKGLLSREELEKRDLKFVEMVLKKAEERRQREKSRETRTSGLGKWIRAVTTRKPD